jgi:hypothetical protein
VADPIVIKSTDKDGETKFVSVTLTLEVNNSNNPYYDAEYPQWFENAKGLSQALTGQPSVGRYIITETTLTEDEFEAAIA